MGKRKRGTFTDDFKQEAVRLTETSGRTIAQVSDDLGIGCRRLRVGRVDAGRRMGQLIWLCVPPIACSAFTVRTEDPSWETNVTNRKKSPRIYDRLKCLSG